MNAVRFYLALGLAALVPLAAGAQPTTPEAVTALLQSEMQAERIPGLVAYVSRGGTVLYHEAHGLADASAGTPMTPATLSVLASVSKTFTATALMTLYDQGRFALDDPINDHLPFQVVHPDFPDTDITFQMLLTHQSGIEDSGAVDLDTDGDSPVTLDAFVRGLFVPGGAYYSEDSFGGEPGTGYSYTNDGVALMGYLVEQISGTTFEAYSQAALFAPLGMDRTSWFLAGVAGEPLARPHEWDPDAQTYTTLPHPGFADYPAGQLRTSAAHVGRFLQMFHDGGASGGQQVLQPATVAAMLTPYVANVDGEGLDMGLIWFRATRGGQTSWEHDGSIAGISTFASMLPDQDASVVVLANGEGADLRAVQRALTGFALRSTVGAAEAPAGRVALDAVAPNPVASRATVRYHVPHASAVTVEVFDVLGRRVAVLAEGAVAAGPHQATWAAGAAPSGVYVVRLRAGGTVVSRSVTVARR